MMVMYDNKTCMSFLLVAFNFKLNPSVVSPLEATIHDPKSYIFGELTSSEDVCKSC
jgi:hypothetical protein